MSEKGYYCCFYCPEASDNKKNIKDKCPKCGRPYDFPLTNIPSKIRDYNILSPISRGFYATTYLSEWGALKQKRVLKIIPKKVYEFFKKDFIQECDLHNNIATESNHLVQILDRFEHKINFNKDELECYVAVLDYISGDPLSEILEDESKEVSVISVAQIAIDLYRLYEELETRNIYHNDLHPKNIIVKRLSMPRAEAIDESIQVVAIDLGSLSQLSRSDSLQGRLGDIHYIAMHLRNLVKRLTYDIDNVDDMEFRVATVLENQASLLAPASEMQRPPNPRELIEEIKTSYNRICSPWQDTLILKKFDDAYNAQSLSPWFVPQLLVDPEGKWVSKMSTRGPQLITGMRGCGKTMLLRALQFHARIAKYQEEGGNIIKKLEKDGFVGLMVSCTRLLDTLGSSTNKINKPFERIFCSYVIQAIQAIRHLKEVSVKIVSPYSYRTLAEAIDNCLDTKIKWKSIGTESELERRLTKLLLDIRENGDDIKLKVSHPSHAFEYLAEAIRNTATIWNKSYILFLVDDVSTRYISYDTINKLIPNLMVHSEVFAFKLTTEAQILELPLTSPGELEYARQDRDFEIFDLGSEVYQITGGKDKKRAKTFLENILAQRARYCPEHPEGVNPSDVLGDISMSNIAMNIASSKKNSRERKKIYHGISALAGVCVGDIGDVITLYELILKKAQQQHCPVDTEIQSQCYQDLCSRRLYDLNRRQSTLKDFALTFAEAAYELLIQSYKELNNGKREELRQYNQVYVRSTEGDTKKQFKKLRELIDAGVFVLKGGSQTPRTKTRDSDPIGQFVLTYRKIYGLSNFMPLSERDRFELSGKQLEEWLNNPQNGKEILLRNLGGAIPEDEITEHEDYRKKIKKRKSKDKLLYKVGTSKGNGNNFKEVQEELKRQKSRFSINKISPHELSNVKFDNVIIGLGFEERTIDSLINILDLIKTDNIIMVKYKEEGKTNEILKKLKNHDLNKNTISYSEIIRSGFNNLEGNTLIDVTGLAKPAIFYSVRNSLKNENKLVICHTSAQQYYPLDTDINNILDAIDKGDINQLLDDLKRILTGEKGPYNIDPLIKSDAISSRRRALCAFSSPKHERLLTLLDRREFDRIQIGVDVSDNPRSKLSNLIAETASSNYGAFVEKCDYDNFSELVEFVENSYRFWYVKKGFDFECSLTGSKLGAVAFSIISTCYKISQCWYIRPSDFDLKRFTKGTGLSNYYVVRIDQ